MSLTPDTYQPPTGYLTLKQARERLGVSKTKAWQVARGGRLPVHTDRRDGQVKLVQIADVEHLMQPRPVGVTGSGELIHVAIARATLSVMEAPDDRFG